jgi:hypothetical protein
MKTLAEKKAGKREVKIQKNSKEMEMWFRLVGHMAVRRMRRKKREVELKVQTKKVKKRVSEEEAAARGVEIQDNSEEMEGKN